MKNFQYKSPGKYIAICNKTNFDGHYTKEFDFPDKDDKQMTIKDDRVYYTTGQETGDEQPITASWYFLNRIDIVACLEAVYPAEIFQTNPRSTNNPPINQ